MSVDLQQRAQELEDISRGVGIPAHRQALEEIARDLRELDPKPPEDPALAFDQAIAQAEAADPKTVGYTVAWDRAIAYGLRALVAAGSTTIVNSFVGQREEDLVPIPDLRTATVVQLVGALRNDERAAAWAGHVEIPAVIDELARRTLASPDVDLFGAAGARLRSEEEEAIAAARDRLSAGKPPEPGPPGPPDPPRPPGHRPVA